jgi:hypothetical protein
LNIADALEEKLNLQIEAAVTFSAQRPQPRSQGFSLFVIGRSHDFQHPDIVGVINYNNNELENPRWPPT